AAAAEEARPADDDGGDRGELHEVAGGRVGGVRLPGDDDRGGPGAHAAEDVDGDEDAVDGDADPPGGLPVAADRVDPLPPGDAPEEQVDEHGEDGDEDDRPRHVADAARADRRHRLGHPGDRLPVAHEERDPAGDHEHGEGGQEGVGQLPLDEEGAVDGTGEPADEDHRRDDEPPGDEVEVADPQRPDHARHRDDRPDRQVDAGGDDDEELPEG